MENRAIALGEDLRSGQPTPATKEGGLSPLREKSLGCMYKAGTAPSKSALNYAELLPWRKGPLLYGYPSQDIGSITGMVAGGAQVVIFSTSTWHPTGSPIARSSKSPATTPPTAR